MTWVSKRIITDENGYLREENNLDSRGIPGLVPRLVHRTIAYEKIWIPNQQSFFDGKFSDYQVHHIDGDKLNNEVRNLSIISDVLHVEWHSLFGYEENKTKKYLRKFQQFMKSKGREMNGAWITHVKRIEPIQVPMERMKRKSVGSAKIIQTESLPIGVPPEEDSEEEPTPIEPLKEKKSNFWWWILELLLLVGVAGNLIYGTLQGVIIFSIIWFIKNVLWYNKDLK